MTITEWLNSDRNYATGVDLYNTHGTNVNLKRFFTRPETKLTTDKLLYELQQLAAPTPDTVPTPKPEDFIKHTPITKPKIDRALLPQQYQALDVKKGRLYDMARYLRTQLENAVEQNQKEKLSDLSLKIVKTWREIDAIWLKLDYWNEHGQMMPETGKAAIDLDTATENEMLKHRNNLRSNVSKLKKNPKRVNDLIEKQKQLDIVVKKLIEKYGVG